MLSLMNDQQQQHHQQKGQSYPAASIVSTHLAKVNQQTRLNTMEHISIAEPDDNWKRLCQPGPVSEPLTMTGDSAAVQRCSSSTVASSSLYSPPPAPPSSPPLLPPKRACHHRQHQYHLQRAALVASAGPCDRLIFRPVALRPQQALVPGFESLSLNPHSQQQQQQHLQTSGGNDEGGQNINNNNSNSSSSPDTRCQSQPSFHAAPKRKHCDSCPCPGSAGDVRLSHTGRSYLIGLPTINSATNSSSLSAAAAAAVADSSDEEEEDLDDADEDNYDEERLAHAPVDSEADFEQLDLDQIESDCKS